METKKNTAQIFADKIKLNVYNHSGDIIRSGYIIFNFQNNTITTNSNRVYKVVEDKNREFVYKFQKTQVKAIDGIKGFYEVVNDYNNKKNCVFNRYIIDLLINK